MLPSCAPETLAVMVDDCVSVQSQFITLWYGYSIGILVIMLLDISLFLSSQCVHGTITDTSVHWVMAEASLLALARGRANLSFGHSPRQAADVVLQELVLAFEFVVIRLDLVDSFR